MTLHPDMARIASAATAMPPLESLELADLRSAVNAAAAKMPKLDVAPADTCRG